MVAYNGSTRGYQKPHNINSNGAYSPDEIQIHQNCYKKVSQAHNIQNDLNQLYSKAYASQTLSAQSQNIPPHLKLLGHSTYPPNHNSQHDQILTGDAFGNKKLCECNECEAVKSSQQQMLPGTKQGQSAYCPCSFPNCVYKSSHLNVNSPIHSTQPSKSTTPVKSGHQQMHLYNPGYLEANKDGAHSSVPANPASNPLVFRPHTSIDPTNYMGYWNGSPILASGSQQSMPAFNYNYTSYFNGHPSSSSNVQQQQQAWTGMQAQVQKPVRKFKK